MANINSKIINLAIFWPRWYVALDDVTVFEAAELDAIALLADTWNDDLHPVVSAQLVQANAQAYLSFGKEKGKGKGKAKGKGKGRYSVCPSHLSLEGRRKSTERTESKNRMSCLWPKGTLGKRSRKCDVFFQLI